MARNIEENSTVAVGIVTISKGIACSGDKDAESIPRPAPAALTKLPINNTTDDTCCSTACGVDGAIDIRPVIQERKGIVFMDT